MAALTKTARPGPADLAAFPAGAWRAAMPGSGRAHLTLNGRNALYLALAPLGIRPGATVLLPAFHCTALVEPFLAYGCRVRYYAVGTDLTLDIAALDGLAAESGAAALLFVHFFGLPGPATALRALCDRRGLKLIEDCTHTLFATAPEGPLGMHGDASVFSFRKILCVEDGGALIFPRSSAQVTPGPLASPLVYHARMLRWTLEHLAGRGGPGAHADPHANAEAGKGSGGETHAADDVPDNTAPPTAAASAGIRADGPAKGPDSHEDPTFVKGYASWAMSWPSRWILAGCRPGYLVAARRRNYLRLENALAKIPGLTFLSQGLAEGLCPLGFPFLAENHPRLDYALRRRGVPAFSFGETLHAGLDKQAFPDAVHLSAHLVLLPVHQGLSHADLDAMAETVKACLGPSPVSRRLA